MISLINDATTVAERTGKKSTEFISLFRTIIFLKPERGTLEREIKGCHSPSPSHSFDFENIKGNIIIIIIVIFVSVQFPSINGGIHSHLNRTD